jgi:hypothetical protein
VDLTSFTPAGGGFLALYDSTPALLESKSSAPFHLQRAVASGKYFIAVYTANGPFSNTPYQLTVTWP